MRPSEEFLLVMVRMLQAIRRECGLDEVIQNQTTGIRSVGAHIRAADQHGRSVAQQLALMERMEEQLPDALLEQLLAKVQPDSRDAQALEAEIGYRAMRASAPEGQKGGARTIIARARDCPLALVPRHGGPAA
jgi:hypothetical protein